jgi:esterase/lipase
MIWDFEQLLARRLLLWALVSILVGSALILFGGVFQQGIGVQAIAWGAVDAAIAWLGLRRARKHLGRPSAIAEETEEAQRIRRILWINNALDVVYVAGGTALVLFYGRELPFWRGAGWGVIIQGAFLFTFDLWHALKVPDPLQLPAAPLFTHPDHAPFLFEGGAPAALLVHGFPGTALEMRPIGRALADLGWTVQGVRLPGFGEDLATVLHHRNAEWVAYLQEQRRALRDRGHTSLLLVGLSFGGGLALQAAAEDPPEGLVLLAPLTWQEPPLIRVLTDAARAILPLSIHPLNPRILSSPTLRKEFAQYLPEINLDDPNHTAELMHLEVPLYILDQFRSVGRGAWAAATKINLPTLLIQGREDPIIRPERTQKLLERIPGPVTYAVVEGPHSLTMPHNPGFEKVLEHITAFAGEIAPVSTKEQGGPLS